MDEINELDELDDLDEVDELDELKGVQKKPQLFPRCIQYQFSLTYYTKDKFFL